MLNVGIDKILGGALTMSANAVDTRISSTKTTTEFVLKLGVSIAKATANFILTTFSWEIWENAFTLTGLFEGTKSNIQSPVEIFHIVNRFCAPFPERHHKVGVRVKAHSFPSQI